MAAKAVVGAIFTVALIGAIVFACAGTFHYWQAWAFLGVYTACMVATSLYFWFHDRALFERRMNVGPTAEHEGAQKVIMALMSIGFILLVAVPGLDHRFAWSVDVPILAVIGNILIVAGFYGVSLVLRQNSFAASTIQVTGDQPVISTGLYGIVRHPMYAFALPLLLGFPLALGSYWGVLVLVAMTPVLIWRLLDEEAYLEKNLSGYVEYQSKVRWRLLPGVF